MNKPNQVHVTLAPSQMAPNIPSSNFTVELTPKEVHRLTVALNHYIDSFGDVLSDSEVARYEDLNYRFMGLPDEVIGESIVTLRHQERQSCAN